MSDRLVVVCPLPPLEWFDLGYKLYNDRETCPIKFLAGDVFDPTFLSPKPQADALPPSDADLKALSSLDALTGQVRCLSAFSFFHLFTEPAQEALGRKLGALLKPQTGSMLFGSHVGSQEAGIIRDELRGGDKAMYCHSPQSWKDLWETVIFPASRQPKGSPGIKVEANAELTDSRPGAAGLHLSKTDGVKKIMVWSVTVL